MAAKFTTFNELHASEKDSAKLAMSRDKWEAFIKPYLELEAGQDYKAAIQA